MAPAFVKNILKFYRTRLNFVPLTCQKVERNDTDAYDVDDYGGTEIEMSNYLALLTHIGLSSCGQTVQHPLCCHRRAQWDRIWLCKLHMPKSVENGSSLTRQLLIIF